MKSFEFCSQLSSTEVYVGSDARFVRTQGIKKITSPTTALAYICKLGDGE